MTSMGKLMAGGLLACVGMVVAAGPLLGAGQNEPGAPADAPQTHDWEHHGWHHHHGGEAAMFRGLGLTDTQRASMKSILETAQPAMQDLHEKLQANFRLLRETTPDDKAYAQVAARVSQENGALTAKLIGARTKVYSQCYALLAPVQKIHLAELQAKRARWTEERKQHWQEHLRQMHEGHAPAPST